MTTQEARLLGKAHGLGIAKNNPDSVQAWEAIEHFRQFSPFEIYASEFNKDASGRKWIAYENGLADGIEKHFLQN